MKFVFFSVSENGENRLSDEGAEGGGAMPPRIFGLEPPLYLRAFDNEFVDRVKLNIKDRCT